MTEKIEFQVKDTQTSIMGLLAGGCLVVLPLFLLGLVVQKVFLALQEVSQPLLNALPGTVFRNESVRFVAVCFWLVILLILVGLVARTRAAQAAGRWLESMILNRVPLYTMLRSLVSGLAAGDNEKSLKPVLVTVDVPGLQQLGFIVEQYPDGSATIFLPSSPNPANGTVVVVAPERICELRIPTHAIFMCMGRWGKGTAALLEKGRDSKQ